MNFGMEWFNATFPHLAAESSELQEDVGKKVRFRTPSCPAEHGIFEIMGIQRIYDGRLAYRVVGGDYDRQGFGRPALPDEVDTAEEGVSE